MTRFLLIRHGLNDYVGRRLAGRLPGIHLNAVGRRQANELASRLDGQPIDAIYSSPLERATETAAPLAQRRGLKVETVESLTEINFGHWSGRLISELDQDGDWQKFIHFRSGMRIPGGELRIESQQRVVDFIQRLHETLPGKNVALVSHADVIKAALIFYLGAPLDYLARIEIDPASISIIELDETNARILAVNR